MTERSFDDGYWTHPTTQPFSKDAKYLYIYLWTNKHCNPSGLYQITSRTISFESSIEEEKLPDLFSELTDRVAWYPEFNLIWVKNFIKRQSKSPKFLIAGAKALTVLNESLRLKCNGVINELIQYNYTIFSISIPYPYNTDSLTDTDTDTNTNNTLRGDSKGGNGDFGNFLKELESEYSDLDVKKEWKRCQEWWNEGKRKMSRPKTALRNWLEKAVRIREEQRKGGQGGSHQEHTGQGNKKTTDAERRASLTPKSDLPNLQ